MNLNGKYESLRRILHRLGRVVIGYSGGVDSTFLLKAAVETLGPKNVLACIGVSPSLAKSQYKQAIKCAKLIGATVRTVSVDELADDRYKANKADRCFHCKSHLFSRFLDIARQEGFAAVLSGSNFDDLKDFRPGSEAEKKLGIVRPLVDAKLTKADIRSLSRRFKLPTADVPASPCLASRIIYGLEVTAEKLRQVEQAEEYLAKLGFAEFRVRHHDTVARIEVRPEDIEKILKKSVRERIVKRLKLLGFKYISVDMQGFRSGSLNEVLTKSL